MSKRPSNTLDFGDCACFNLRKASRSITQFYDRAMKPLALRGTQFSILAVLSKTGPRAMGALAQFLIMDRTTLTRNLKPLEKQELIRMTTGQDQRKRVIQLTDSGEEMLRAARPIWEQVQSEVLARVEEAQFEQLLKTLKKIEGLSQ